MSEVEKYLKSTGNGLFALDANKQPIPASIIEWGKMMQSQDRHVGTDMIGDVRISTVFLGMDHGFGREPVLFETMIFGGKHDGYQDRCCTWGQAEVMHEKALNIVKGASDE